MSTMGDIMSTMGNIMSTTGDITSTVGDILSSMRDVQYCRGFMIHVRGSNEYCRGVQCCGSTLIRKDYIPHSTNPPPPTVLTISPTFIMISSMVLNIPHGTQDMLHSLMISPHSTNDILHGTEHTLDRVTILNPIRPGGGSEARMTKLTADNQKPLTL